MYRFLLVLVGYLLAQCPHSPRPGSFAVGRKSEEEQEKISDLMHPFSVFFEMEPF